MNEQELTMHKLMGEHIYSPHLNEEIFETESVCDVCGYVKNKRPKNIKDSQHFIDAFRYGMISSDEVLDKMGLPLMPDPEVPLKTS